MQMSSDTKDMPKEEGGPANISLPSWALVQMLVTHLSHKVWHSRAEVVTAHTWPHESDLRVVPQNKTQCRTASIPHRYT